MFEVGDGCHLRGWISAVLIHQLRELCTRSVIVPAALRVGEVHWLSQVKILQQVPSKTSDIGCFKREATTDLPLERKVERFGIGRLQLAVDAPRDRKVI